MKLKNAHRKAWIAFFVAHGVLSREVERALAEAGQPSLEVYDVLLSLEMAPGQRLRMSELADRLVYSRSGLTRLADRIERLGWIAREGCPNDRRATHAVLTPAGLAAREAAWPVYQSAIQEHFGSKLSEAEANQIADSLGRFVDCELLED